jgi:hypothetical protein
MQELTKDFNDGLSSHFLTLEEIEVRYPGEWVVLDEVDFVGKSELTGGRVVFHSKGRDEAWARALEIRPKRAAVLFMGEPDPDMTFMLSPILIEDE